MKLHIAYIFIVLFSAATPAFAQKDNRLVRQGNKEFDKQNYTEAETSYLKALDVNRSSTPASYNLGATRYRQDSMAQAVQNWTVTALNQANSADMRSQSFYNIGNAMMATENYQQSIESYKQALRLNPNDDEARYNLAYAQQMLKQQEQDQQGGGDNKKDQNKDNKKDQNQDQQQDQDQQDQQDQQNQQGQDQQQDQQQQSQQQHQQEISKEEAERMLEAMKNNEKKTLDKVKQQQVGKPQKTEKDW